MLSITILFVSTWTMIIKAFSQVPLGPNSCISRFTKIFFQKCVYAYNQIGWQNRVKSVSDSTEPANYTVFKSISNSANC
jgi:hypothetical protein